MMVWCPMMIKMRENFNFKQYELYQGSLPAESSKMIQHEPLYEALNAKEFRGSLKEAYCGLSMAKPVIVDEINADDSDSDDLIEN